MFTLTCCLRFNDGQSVTAKINAKSRTEDVAVSYGGPVERLPLVQETANGIELRAYFKSFARELKAHFTEVETDDQAMALREIDRLLTDLERLAHRRESKRRPSSAGHHAANRMEKDHSELPDP